MVAGLDPLTEEESFKGFQKEIVDKGFCNPKFADLQQVYDSMEISLTDKELKDKLTYAKQLYEDVTEAFKQIDNSFNFKKRY